MYGILIEMLAKGAGLQAGTLTCQMGDVHLYDNHREAAKQQIGNKTHPFCRLELKKGLHSVGRSIQIPKVQDVSIHDYVSSGKIKATLPV
jgi:thymidylate synthase